MDVEYNFIFEKYKFLKIRFFDNQDSRCKYILSLLPDWIIADTESGKLIIYATTMKALGNHYLYSIITKSIENEAFLGISGITSEE